MPVVERRNKDKDPIARVASKILERARRYSLSFESDNFDEVMRLSLLDRLLSGLGAACVYYKPYLKSEGENESVYFAEIQTHYIHYTDFGFTPTARVWSEVTEAWKRCYFNKTELKERFPEIWNEIPLDASAKRNPFDDDIEETEDKALVYEFWHYVQEAISQLFLIYQHFLIVVYHDPQY